MLKLYIGISACDIIAETLSGLPNAEAELPGSPPGEKSNP